MPPLRTSWSRRADAELHRPTRARETAAGTEGARAGYFEAEKITTPFPRISYDEAVAILQKNGSEIQWGEDFGGGDETIISQQFDRP
jgi:aspartyl/asparaginyl-tRNA synthetase